MPALTYFPGVDANEYVRFHCRFRNVFDFGTAVVGLGTRWPIVS